MAEVRAPIVPSRIYRYRSLTRSPTALDEEIDSIENNYLYCPEFTRMNDPMEGFFDPAGFSGAKPITRKSSARSRIPSPGLALHVSARRMKVL